MAREEESGAHLTIVRRTGRARIGVRAHGGGAGGARSRIEPRQVLGAEV
jgi:hypothetical protein